MVINFVLAQFPLAENGVLRIPLLQSWEKIKSEISIIYFNQTI